MLYHGNTSIYKKAFGCVLIYITFVSVLASYFDISMDELFDFNLNEIESAVKFIADETTNTDKVILLRVSEFLKEN